MSLALDKDRIPATAFLIVLCAGALAGTAWALFGAIHLVPASLVTMAIAATVSVFAIRFQFRLPRSQELLPLPNAFAFWAVFWFGLPAGIVLGTFVALLTFLPKRAPKRQWLFSVSGVALSTAVAVSAYSFFFGSPPHFGSEAGLDAAGLGTIIGGSLFVGFVYLLLSFSFFVLFHTLEGDSQTPRATITRLTHQSLASLIVSAVTVAICLTFAHFGIAFGLVFAPAVVFAKLAYSIHLRRIEQKTRQITEASRIHVATVEALATAIDARDQIGLGHVRRTQIYAIGLGELLGLGEDEINALRTGSLLHDIGKLAIPDHILSKPGKLTPAELEKAKIHSSVGASILEKVDFNYPVVSAVKYHHERWDGLGYPEGLKGEDIPLTARVLAVADSYDTLRGARPYRPAHPRERARAIIAEGSGNRFDPTVVRYFLKNLGRLEEQINANGLSYALDEDPENASALSSLNYVEQIKRANREVVTLYELAREFSSSFELHETLALFTRKLREFVPYVTCAVFLLDEKKSFATVVHVDGENKSILTSRHIKVGQGATGFALKKRALVKNANPDLGSYSQVELAEPYSTMASVPLIADEVLIGAVSIYAREMKGYGEEHLRVFETIAHIAAEAISKSMQHDEVKAHAMTDPMTGLPNARYLQIQFEKEVGRASRSGGCFQLLMLDLDGFKAVNDSFGHKTGDDILREIGTVIRGELRDYDFLARYGGDEFVALIPDTSREDVVDLCRRIENAVCNFKLEVEPNKYASVGVSLGSAGYPAQGETFNQMIVSADKEMYERKSRRKSINSAPVPTLLAEPSEPPIEVIADADIVLDPDTFIVELDETNVVSGAVN